MREWKGGITYVHCPGWTAQRVVANARKLYARGLCDVVVVDYLQKVALVGRNGQNEASWIAHTVEAFKTMAEQLAIPALLGSQLNRDGQRDNRKTSIGIRGSGEIEEKANYIITLDRPVLDEPVRNEQGRIIANEGDRSPEVKVRVDKNTLGPTGECEMVINAPRFLMLDVAPASEPDPVNF
jgi:replicative DNA helicase